MLDGIVAFLKSKFGERAVILFGFWSGVVLIVVTIYTFAIRETSATFDKYYAFKLEKCADAALTVARISNATDLDTLRKALARFDELYYGELMLFEGSELAAQMVRYREQLAPRDEDFDPEKIIAATSDLKKIRRQMSLQLATECRREVRPSLWYLIRDRLFPISR
jgi:hypothetical protein